MSLYYFQIAARNPTPDQYGVELPDLEAARVEVRTCGEILRDWADGFWERKALRMEVVDEAGRRLFALHVAAVEAVADADVATSCDLNAATAEEIAALPGMTPARALDLVLWRPYRSWAALENSPGFGEADGSALRAVGAFLGPAPALPDWRPIFKT